MNDIYPPDRLHFLPLGGSGEIGMNLNLFAYGGKWLMVDLGVTFGNEENLGVDVIMPDPAFIVERRHALIGLVLTHAHEDHLGAVQYLWPKLRCPVWATPFAAGLLRRKLAEVGLEREVPITIYRPGDTISLTPFEIEPLYITHSIPEMMGLAIRTPVGTVLHTGDWKFDDRPVLGPASDEAGLRRVGEEGVLALIGDSTNALKPGESGSEADVKVALTKLIARQKHRVAVACFASNVGRLETIAHAARAAGREVALVGRSLWRMNEVARECGYLDGITFLNESDAGFVPRERLLMICTGSQGESRAALSRIAAGEHAHVDLERGDTVIFSSRNIPGNERAILNLQNTLARLGVSVITDEDMPPEKGGPIHVSGHPNQGELARMYQFVRPRIAVPVHGEAMHMQAHADLARACQVPFTIVPHNGTVVELSPDGPRIVDEVFAGRVGVDGDRLIKLDGDIIKSRTRMMWNGAVIATVVVDRKGRVMTDPQVTAPGLFEEDDPALDEIATVVRKAVAGAKGDGRDAAIKAIRRWARDNLDKKPKVDVHLVTL